MMWGRRPAGGGGGRAWGPHGGSGHPQSQQQRSGTYGGYDSLEGPGSAFEQESQHSWGSEGTDFAAPPPPPPPLQRQLQPAGAYQRQQAFQSGVPVGRGHASRDSSPMLQNRVRP